MATKTITKFITEVNAKTATVLGQPVQRDISSMEISYVEGLMRDSYKSVVDDLEQDLVAGGNAVVNAWKFAVTDLDTNTHISELFPPILAAKIKNNPNSDNCIIINHVDNKIKEANNWVELNGAPRDKAIWILGSDVYVVDEVKFPHVHEAALTYAQIKSRESIRNSTGTCSNTSYVKYADCVNNGGTWTSNIADAELTFLNNEYTTKLTDAINA